MTTGKHWKFMLFLTKTSSKQFFKPYFNRFLLHLSKQPGFTAKVSAYLETSEGIL